jgi:ribosomal protein S25
LCTKQQTCNICEEKTYRIESRTDKSTSIVGDFNTALNVDRKTIQKINKDIEEFNMINHQELMDIYRQLHTITAIYTFF